MSNATCIGCGTPNSTTGGRFCEACRLAERADATPQSNAAAAVASVAVKTRELPLWSDEYRGPRWTYGLTYRPLATFHVPPGWIINPARQVPHEGYAHGTVDYPRELTAREVQAHELTFVYATPGQ